MYGNLTMLEDIFELFLDFGKKFQTFIDFATKKLS